MHIEASMFELFGMVDQYSFHQQTTASGAL